MLKKLIKIGKWVGGILLSIFLLISLLLYAYEDEIKQYAVTKLNDHLNTKVEVEEIELVFWSTFPYASLEFNNVLIRDAFPGQDSKDTLFSAEKVYFKFSLKDLWNDDYKVKKALLENGVLHLKVNEPGEVNYDVLKPTDSQSDSKFDFELEDVSLKNMRLKYSDEKNKQYFHFNTGNTTLTGAFSESKYAMEMSSDLKIDKIQKGSVPFIADRKSQLSLTLNIDNDQNKYEITNGKFSVGEMKFIAEGSMHHDSINLQLNGDQIGIDDLARTFQDKNIQKTLDYKGDGILDFLLTLNYDSTMMESDINVEFAINNGQLSVKEQNISLKELNLTGSYKNFAGQQPDMLKISEISGKTFNGGFHGNLLMRNSVQPKLSVDLDGSFDLNIIHQLFIPTAAKSMKGMMATDLQMLLNWDQYGDAHLTSIKGNVHFNEVAVNLDALPHPIHHLSGDFALNNNFLRFTDVELKYASSDLKGSGKINNLLNAIKSPNQNLIVQTNIEANQLTVEDFYKSSGASGSSTEHIFPQGLQLSATAKVKHLEVDNHPFEKVNASFNLNSSELYFYSLSFQHAEGNVRGSAKIIEHSEKPFDLMANLKLSQINVKTLFKEWNNFQQTTILDKNISGKLNANIDLYIPVGRNGAAVLKDLESEIQMTLTNGALVNLSSFKSITEFLRSQKVVNALIKKHINYMEKKLMNVQFETLTNTIHIKNQKLVIPKMSINSSALDINIEGTHHFNNIVDYHLDFRFRELKVDKNNAEFGDVVDDGTGLRIFLNMSGHIDDLKYSRDEEKRKETRKEKMEEEKSTVKSMLNEDFGLFKNDTTIKKVEKEKEPEPEFEYYEGVFEDTTKNIEPKEKEKGFFKNFIDKTKKEKEQKEEKEVEIEF